jgi:hypothetical protein
MCSLLVIFSESCIGRTDESFTEVRNGAFKVEVRTREVHNSGVRNIDACVADDSSRDFPSGKAQCFLHGFDFSDLSFKWQSQSEIEVSFDCGYVSLFRNYAIIPHGLHPVEFHVTLRDVCGSRSKGDAGG